MGRERGMHLETGGNFRQSLVLDRQYAVCMLQQLVEGQQSVVGGGHDIVILGRKDGACKPQDAGELILHNGSAGSCSALVMLFVNIMRNMFQVGQSQQHKPGCNRPAIAPGCRSLPCPGRSAITCNTCVHASAGHALPDTDPAAGPPQQFQRACRSPGGTTTVPPVTMCNRLSQRTPVSHAYRSGCG